LIQGALAILLARWSGQEDVAYGAVVLGRPAEIPGVEEIVGVFINTLVLRCSVEPDARLAPWLGRLQARWARAREFEWTPLAKVQGWSDLPRGAPMFTSVLSVAAGPKVLGDPVSSPRGRSGGIGELRTLDQTNVPLNFEVALGDDVALELRYDRAL